MIHFSGLEAPVLLKNAAALLPVVAKVLPSWPFRVADADENLFPCMTITGKDDGLYYCETHNIADDPYEWDAVNTVCELVVALAWEQINAQPQWLCLHCAAVEFNGRLVLFPNRRRGGKSTLTAVLAERGFRVFTDDFLPVKVDKNGTMLGCANGVLPRLRLPIADGFSSTFRDWVGKNTEISNNQYAYLDVPDLASRGALLPIGAIVILDRQDDVTVPNLNQVEAIDVLDDLITQNFARLAHSGRILRASQGVAETAEKFRLQYQSAEEAATFIESHFQTWDRPAAWVQNVEIVPDLAVQEMLSDNTQPAFDPAQVYERAQGVTEICLADTIYVADGYGIGIQKLNQGSGLIWQILEEKASAVEVSDLLATAFPDEPAEKILADCTQTLQQFLQNRLIAPAYAFEEATA